MLDDLFTFLSCPFFFSLYKLSFLCFSGLGGRDVSSINLFFYLSEHVIIHTEEAVRQVYLPEDEFFYYFFLFDARVGVGPFDYFILYSFEERVLFHWGFHLSPLFVE